MLDLLAWALATPALVATGVFAVEIGLGLLPSRSVSAIDNGTPRTVVLVPAHDEALGISGTVKALLPLLPSSASLLVVADNCQDETAKLARAAGAEVIERNDPVFRGKGYALAFGREHLRLRPPECVLVLDADCAAEPGAVAMLARAAVQSGRAVQGTNLLRPRPAASPMVQISTFAFLVKNFIRQRGLARLGAPALLTGTGTAFPWTLFVRAPLASGDIVEDLALTLDLAEAGAPPSFLPAARVWSGAEDTSATLSQRGRWEGGFLATARRRAIPAILRGITKLRPGVLWLGMHLLVPPLALLIMLDLGVSVVLVALAFGGADWMPLAALGFLLATTAAGLAAVWWRQGRAFLSARSLARTPAYMIWKLPIYLQALKGTRRDWVRTPRG